MTPSLQGKVALVTGGGRGIGEATAKLFADEGARVWITSRTASELKRVSESKPGIQVVAGDVSDEKFVEDLFQQIALKEKRLDILVNNAAIIEISPIETMSLDAWDRTMSVNMRGVFLCSREALHLMKSGGSIVNVSSIAGLRGVDKFDGFGAYTASKAGVIGFTEVLAQEAKAKGIRANAIAPGAVQTKMLEQALPGYKTQTKPDDLARLILFLADSARSGQLSGSTLECFTNAE